MVLWGVPSLRFPPISPHSWHLVPDSSGWRLETSSTYPHPDSVPGSGGRCWVPVVPAQGLLLSQTPPEKRSWRPWGWPSE